MTKEIPKTRLETNFVRLLDQCKAMANNGKHTEWRFEQYVVTLESYLAELRTSPAGPDKEVLDEYARAVGFLKALDNTEKLPSVAEKAVASQFLSPSQSAFADPVSAEIHHKLAARFTNQARRELMAADADTAAAATTTVDPVNPMNPSNPVGESEQSALRRRQPGTDRSSSPPREFDAVMREEQKTQDAITGDMLMLTRSLKEQTAAFHALVRNDVETLTKSTQLAEQHQRQLGVQTLKLRQRSGFCGRCWIWLIILLICVLFIGMIVFMRLFKKRSP